MLRLITLLIAFATQLCFAQNMVSGKVVDELGFPLYKASISIADSEEVAYTDYDGKFTLESSKKFHWKVKIDSKGFEPVFFFVLSGGSMETIMLKFDIDLEELISEEAPPENKEKSLKNGSGAPKTEEPH